jgi:magnesium transporter
LEKGEALRVLRKESAVGVINGLVLGTAIGLIGFIWKGSILLGVVAGAAMAVNQIIGAVLGVAAPLTMRACGVDPALASSIFVTTFTDIMGFLVFLGLAAAAMAFFL